MSDTESDTAQAILAIVRTHLTEPDMGVDDDFYAMGGDSLIALRVVADANRLGIPIDLLDLLYHPTVRELAAVATGPGVPASVASAVSAAASVGESAGASFGEPPFGQPLSRLDPYDRATLPPGVVDARPASALQTGLIYLCESARDPHLYHDLIGLEVHGPFDPARFEQALAALCERHEALRSSFDLGGFTEPLHLVWSEVPVPLTVEQSPTAEAAQQWRQQELSQPIDWAHAPLFRCHVAALPTSFHLALAIHHAIADGWSLARLVTDLLLLYDAALTDRPAELPAVPADGYARFQSLERAAVESAAAADFWRAEADVPPLLLQRGRFAGPADPAETTSFAIEPALLKGLRGSAADLGVPLKSLVLGCHVGALARWADRQTDVVTGLTVNGRPETPDADLLVGLFLNTVPVRFSTADGSWASLARTALDAERRVLAHRRYPLARIEQLLGRPSFDVSFNFTDFHVYRELGRLQELRAGSWWTFDKTSFPVTVDFMIESRQSGTGVQVAYDPGLVPKERAEQYAEHFRDLLHSAAARTS
jgi:Condensation domain/Phosphopantetheine attachment site